MYIKEILLDGFKSYGTRTEIKNFDPLFNAITGLNGSGKSNILDAICFVLGISNLNQVRAGNLQDLVYKFGQAGVTKASVSITFDNTDKRASPIGYEDYNEIVVTRQVVVGGKNRYLINGLNINNKRVQDLFRSVQLNVNNPTFLIMQGRITKVLNMKPQEILGMIEEAAGTKMYEHKKMTALNTIEKKDAKLNEIKRVLDETINPTIEKLKKERSQYLEYQQLNRNVLYQTRQYTVHYYHYMKKLYEGCAENFENRQKEAQEITKQIDEKDKAVEDNDKKIEEIENRRQKEPKEKLEELRKLCKDCETKETQIKSKLKGNLDSKKSLEKRVRDTENSLKAEENSLAKRQNEVKNKKARFEGIQAQCAADEQALRDAELKVEQASRGNMAGDETSLRNQLDSAKAEAVDSKSKADRAKMAIGPLRAAMQKKEADMKSAKKDYDRSAFSKQALDDAIAKLKRDMSALNFDESVGEQMQQEYDELKDKVTQLHAKLVRFDENNPRFSFLYSDPEPRFDRSKVLGVLCKLFGVKDTKFLTALETAAGGRLFNVVVDTDETGRKILDRGNLSRRVTFVPLNKITGYEVDDKTMKFAESLVGSNKVWKAMDLIEYEPRLRPALVWLFGTQLVCDNMETAKVIAFNPKIRRKCVTLDGDVFDPAGTLSGGARDKTQEILLPVMRYRDDLKNFKESEAKLKELERKMGNPETARKFKALRDQLEMKQHELQGLEDRLAQTDYRKLADEVNELKAQLAKEEQTVKESDDVQKQKQAKVKELEHKLKNLDKLRDSAISDAKKELAACEKKFKASSAEAKSIEQEAMEFEAEEEAAKKDIEEIKNKLQEYREELKAVDEEIPNTEAELRDAQAATNSAKEKVAEQKEQLALADKEIQKAQKAKKDAIKEKHELNLKLQKLEHDIKDAKDQRDTAYDSVTSLMNENDWLQSEVEKLHRTNGAIKSKKDLDALQREIEKMKERMKKMSRNVNVKAMNMLGAMEEKFDGLIQKKQTVENDKKKIEDFIKELDEKKNEVLQKAHEQVNKDFGSIFSELLPGTKAKLVPPANKTVLEGLEVKVAFGDVWKESLAELSGGQRSLVALSLILSILLFKPAPLYILDEVDAALDLSHTQNIGSMLKKHFRSSQFIVVSLKEGMFSNANVLFKTKFVDGMSTVTRTANQNAHRN